jgi:type II secretory pathway pseudopilin PulG
MARAAQDDRSAGFLLVEVVVALIIVALAFGYGFRSLSGALERLGRDHNASAALLLAQSTLDRVGYDIALGQDEISGNTKDGFSWSVQTLPYTSGPVPAVSSLVGYVVRVTVGWKERSNVRQVQLSTVRLVYRGSG